MVNIGFHYISESRWQRIIRREEEESIRPRRRLVSLRCIIDPDIPDLPDWAHEGYVYAFPDKEAPEPWKKYEHWKEQWDRLTGDISDRLVELRFEISPTDKAFVVDRAHVADFQFRHTQDRQEALRRYAFSRVPADQYDGSYRMPELLLRNPIELERLAVHNLIIREERFEKDRCTINYKTCKST